MKLIVGLGNPGDRYERTLHNVGFAVVETIAERLGGEWKASERFRASMAQSEWRAQSILLMKPLTYMNASGEAVGAMMRYRKLEVHDLLVLVDDADLELGRLRIRPSGRSGGHRGLESIGVHVGGFDFARVRIGIGRMGNAELVEHVLRVVSAESWRDEVIPAVARAADAALAAVDKGVDWAMNSFNGPISEGDGNT